ncbi:MAG: catalase [Chloroflexota bacterium]
MGAEPSTDWSEVIPEDEAERFDRHIQTMTNVQKEMSEKYGKGRGLHRKAVLASAGRFTVLGDLPDYCRFGLFANGGTYESVIRLSNASHAIQPDKVPDTRGFSIKVKGLDGDNAMGTGKTDCQDFVLINRSALSSSSADDFVGLAASASQGGLAPVRFLIGSRGFIGGLRTLSKILAGMRSPFSGFASEVFYSAAPLACGPYACRVRLLPAIEGAEPPSDDDVDWGADFRSHLAKGDLTFAFQLQFFVDETNTPIENASVDWAEAVAPYVTVAHLTVPQSALAQSEDQAFAAQIEQEAFDPWRALAEHRPLGSIMRVRKAVYYPSVQGRQ